MQRNRLADETSPYLRQHADNPVAWYPWGGEALLAARRDDKPILLSIGYSACHWCHVMAHESFEDPATAALMNELFVSIKVDREERPDIDKIYQTAQQLITRGAGGWPLTMFLTPAQTPFFGGTYFPKEPRYGMPAFADLLKRVAAYYREHGAEIGNQSAQLRQALASIEPAPAAADTVVDSTPLGAARAALEAAFDPELGGFGRAPKFPHAPSIERALRHWHSTAAGASPDLKSLYMATLSLTRMAEGGIYDQIGGGFARYSVDGRWMIPHFEKMLYDNGALLGEYARAHLATGEPLFARVAAETSDWVLRDMRAPQGGFYSSLDADSEGHEGRFYVWTPAEVEELLSPRELAAFSPHFGLDREANFEGRWHLYVAQSLGDVAGSSARTLIDGARAKLLAARNLRVWPGRDDKILTSWNALMIKGLAIAARALHRPDLAEAAARAVDFVRHRLWRDGRLLATAKDGRAHLAAYLDDYAFLIDALLELLQTRWRGEDLDFARRLAEVLLVQFEDRGSANPGAGADGPGGFFFTACDHETLIHRSKTFADESMPSGNGVAAAALCRLGFLLAEPRYLDAAERALRAGWSGLREYPMAHMSLLNALEDYLAPLQILIIRGPAEAAERWARELGRLYAPTRMILAIPADAEDLPAALADKRAPAAGVAAYVCTGTACSAPIGDLAQLARNLGARWGFSGPG
ncbi:MAG TPA: thioredoxin domain-containing protein [Steroidobacteraceae bacterium]|nr:thioredoxin domain-containing protein [Steroidobacteraceae bacterium]